jgi:hypothetical protein
MRDRADTSRVPVEPTRLLDKEMPDAHRSTVVLSTRCLSFAQLTMTRLLTHSLTHW